MSKEDEVKDFEKRLARVIKDFISNNYPQDAEAGEPTITKSHTYNNKVTYSILVTVQKTS